MPVATRLVAAWYAPRPTLLTASLWPASLLFRAGVALRRSLYRSGVLPSARMRVPVVVVGNVTVGGSGKTPLVRALAEALAARGWRPGIVSRGYGGAEPGPREVARNDDPAAVGDEAPLLAETGFPVWIGRRRAEAASALLTAHPRCNVLLSDDGLQHYALGRTVEIAVIDAARGFGNGMLLPAGPLREPPARLAEVDAIVRRIARAGDFAANDAGTRPGARSAARPQAQAGADTAMTMEPLPWRNVARAGERANPDAWRAGEVHAVAGIGHPERFFDLVRSFGLAPQCHAYPDHHRFTPADLAFAHASAILMTEKDALKCTAFADARCWALPVRARIDPALVDLIEGKIRGSEAA
jgi:tetraacyldisaccharide 4'-kinase